MNREKQQRVSDHEVIELLLPWFINGTLDDVEHDRVAAHVDRCAECQESLGVLQSIQAVAKSDSAVPIVPSPNTNALMSKISNSNMPSRSYAWWGVALAASLVALVLGGFWFLAPGDSEKESLFRTATTDDATAIPIDYVFAVKFEAGSTEADRVGVFDGVADVEFVSEIAPDTYRVVIRLPSSSLEELEQFANDAANQDQVHSVEILALQLPMR